MSEQDTRERLEADVRKFLYEHVDISYGSNDMPQLLIVAYEMLDRQAAITAEETSDAWEEYRDATQREIAELKAESKQLRIDWESERAYADQCEERMEELTAEVEQLKRANRIQAQSFQKLEAELARKTLELAKAKGGTL